MGPRLPRFRSILQGIAAFALGIALAGCASRPTPRAAAPTAGFEPLFPKDGVPAGWQVRSWNDVSQPAPPEAQWIVRRGILQGSNPRGTWLISEKEYGDFLLELEFRLGERGNGGFAFRFPPEGDPSAEGFEVQWVDPRYFGPNYRPEPWELTGALYKAVAPSEFPYQPGEWNRCSILCRGGFVRVDINGVRVVDAHLDRRRHAAARGIPLAERPRRGRIGFQEISRDGGKVEIRNARIRVLEQAAAR